MWKQYRGWKKAVAQTALALGVVAQMTSAGFAASTDISDVPMAVKNQVPPNIMFTLDDSGSMQFEFMPESNMSYSRYLFPLPKKSDGTAYGVYGANMYDDDVALFDDSNVHNFYGRSSANNTLFYNPDITYKPWSKADGSLMAQADPTKARYNPLDADARARIDLTTQQTLPARWFKHSSSLSNRSWECTNSSRRCDKTFWPITYYVYKGSGSRTTYSNYKKVQIETGTPANTTFTSPNGTVRTKAEEIQNFANWFQYHRSRVLVARAGTGAAFAEAVGSTTRVGFAAINKGSATIDNVSSPGAVIMGVRPFADTLAVNNRTAFFNHLYEHNIDSKGTPLRRAADNVGKYFERTDNSGPWGANPGSAVGTQHSCRSSYHLLMTDGYWTDDNNSRAPTEAARSNVDGTNGTQITGEAANGAPLSYTYTASNPYSDAHSDTLADVAMYYWKRDLRPDLTNNVRASPADPAFWQHVTTFTIGLGVNGSVSQSAIDSAFTANPQTIAWPDPKGSNEAKTDDLAHAAINGRGKFFNAASAESYANSLKQALLDIASRTSSAAAVAVANANVVGGDNASYASSYDPSTWWGDLQSYPIELNPTSPDFGKAITSSPSWTQSARAQLDAKPHTSRKIVTYTGTAGANQGIQFQPTTATTATKLSTAQQNLLNTSITPPGPADGASVVAYLRGDRTGESAGTYRTRASVLGDIVNAEPLVIREPRMKFGDAGYITFKSLHANRTKIVLQGANDGMLHAFNAETGAEEWAYVPNLVMANLNGLSRKIGFEHKYYVDATPRFRDIDFAKTDGMAAGASPDWRTIVVGGLGKGGRGYYALDVTQTTAASEAALTSKVLWEFPNSATDEVMKKNVGFTFGRPIIVKTQAKGWVVLVASGYNNGTNTGDSQGDGKGYLFILNPRTGAVIKAISTGVGSGADPSGLAYISGYVQSDDTDATVDYAYGGDLKGNVWRFNLKGSDVNSWAVTRLTTLVDDAGNFQPITTEPELAEIRVAGTKKRMVYVGTGRYLGDSDIAGAAGANIHATQTQSMYGLWDDLTTPAAAAVIQPLRSNLVEQSFGASQSNEQLVTNNPMDWKTKKGWYVDLPVSGERVNTHPAIGIGALVFTSNVPNADPCSPGGTSYLNVLNIANGGILHQSQPWSRMFLGDGLASRPTLIQTSDGKIRVIVRKSDASIVGMEVPEDLTGNIRRVSWREIVQ